MRLVDKVRENQDLQGRNITFDNLYTSVPLAQKLLERKITSVDTMRHNRKGLPKEIKSMEGREPKSSIVYWEKNHQKLTLTTYVVNTKSSGKKNIIVLSFMPPLLGLTKDDDKSKPAIIKLYDFTKGGTDIVDQRSAQNTTSTKSVRWTKKVITYMLDISRVNAQTIFCLNNDHIPRAYDSSDFAQALGMSLIMPHLINRRREDGIPNWLKRKMDIFLPTPEVVRLQIDQAGDLFPHDPNSNKRRIGRQCLNLKQSRSEKDKLGKSYSQCQMCSEAICANHMVKVCSMCKDTLTVHVADDGVAPPVEEVN